MKKAVGFVLGISVAVLTMAQEPYKVAIDLTKVKGDKVKVVIDLPGISQNYIEYHMARSVPGTYDISNFGRFVKDFKAFDNAGEELASDPMGVGRNIYGISNASGLSRISYWVEDTFDEFRGYNDHFLFEPQGSSFEKNRDVFLMNTFAMIGYIDGLKFNPYEISIKHPENIYGATSLNRLSSTADTDVFTADNFNFLADAPIMYCEPDTVTREIAGAKIIVSVFSPNKMMSSNEVMDNIYDLMVAQSEYLGGELPVDRYAYLIYLEDFYSLSESWGALEHSYSSMYTIPEEEADELAQMVRDIAAHEFFHIVTPLNIHSEEIHDFNYIDPEMSQHLWLYEGVTEYSSIHVQVKYDLYDHLTFLDAIREKLLIADEFPDEVSFTEMSKRILEEEYAPLYENVYYKGALIGMCLDLYLLKHSNGEKDLQWLMRELSKVYGKDKPFKDQDLFDKIEELTYPEVGEFLRNHVGGSIPLPIYEALSWAGVTYEPIYSTKVMTLGGIALGLNGDQKLQIADDSNVNDFGLEMGYQNGDVLVTFNGQKVSLINAGEVFDDFIQNFAVGDTVEMVVNRHIEGNMVKLTLSAPAQKEEIFLEHGLSFSEDATDDQLRIQKAWLKAKK
ncbi:MAG: peptidase M61 [Cytophagales bacterium]|nr:peptidase M61 [Cytophagales bacterium]